VTLIIQATFPFDVFKTRMQAASWDLANPMGGEKRPGIVRISVEAVRREGWRVMFAGLGPTLIR
jgi:solute carrier family 25 carnitine/acylcarnitine transporter 20/29